MFNQGHRILGGIKHFWMAVRVWKTNVIVEELARQKRTKMWPKWGVSWGLIDVWQSEWSVVCWIWLAKPSTTQKNCSSCPARDCGHLDAASRQCSLSHCHFRERIFGQKRYFSGSAATILAWSESVWLLPFPKTQIPPQRSSFWKCGQHSKVVTDQLRALLHEYFQHSYREWEQRLRRCVALKGTTLKEIVFIYK